jgi:methyl-accepting chemotaxis protein
MADAPISGVGNDKEILAHKLGALEQAIGDLKELAVAFERWHEDMISLTTQTRAMNSKGDDLATVARHMIMVSVNAAIEAARAGDVAKGFVVVAAEVKSQAQHVQALSNDMGKSLHKSQLITTTTFQDIQAGGKMMMAALSGLERIVKDLRDVVEV